MTWSPPPPVPQKRAKKRKAEEAAVGTREEAEAEPEDEAEDGEGRDGYTLRGHTLRPQDIERITLTLAKKLAVRDQQVWAMDRGSKKLLLLGFVAGGVCSDRCLPRRNLFCLNGLVVQGEALIFQHGGSLHIEMSV